MQLESRKEGDVLVVCCREDRMDAKVAVEFKDEMIRYIDAGNRAIVLSVGQVKFVDSSGLGAMVSSLKHLGRDGEIAVAEVQDSILGMFKLTRMDRVFRMFDTEDAAVQALS